MLPEEANFFAVEDTTLVAKAGHADLRSPRSRGVKCWVPAALIEPLQYVNLSKLNGAVGHHSNLMWTTIMAATVRHQHTVAVRGVVQWRMLGNGTCGRLCLQPCLPVYCE